MPDFRGKPFLPKARTVADLDRQTYHVDPPPTRDEVRAQLGPAVIEAERQAQAERDEFD